MIGDRVHLLSDITAAGSLSDSEGKIERATGAAQSIAEANQAIQTAGDANAHLLVLLGKQELSDDALGMLLEAFRLDAHFGVSVPRVCEAATGEILKLREDLGDPALRHLPRRVLTQTAEYYILPEFLTSCFLVRNELVANLGPLDESYETLAGALQHYLCLIRRAGFRTVVVNQAAVSVNSELTNGSPIASQKDNRRLQLTYPDAGRAQALIAEDPLHLQESLLGRVFSPDLRLSKSMLLDLRGIPSYTNGTVEAVLAVCDALHAAQSGWKVSVLVVAGAADYHKLHERYRQWTILTREGGEFYSVALRLSQPWTFATLLELHGMALINLYSMLDTIAWDILFEAPAGLTAVWTFMGEQADGLLYNSFHTRGHFQRRFPVARGQADLVFHHSFDPRDYADPAIKANPEHEGEYFFIIGNAYDHKHLRPTVDLLSAAFPFRKLKVLGLAEHPGDNVEALKSGDLPAEQIDKLFAGAHLVIFPSMYEGFGFPTLKGLSYGRNVIARRSELLTEIAANYSGPGKLYAYSHPVELVETIGQLVHGRAPEAIPLRSSEAPKNWNGIANGILDFVEERLARADGAHWVKRDRAIRQLEAFCE